VERHHTSRPVRKATYELDERLKNKNAQHVIGFMV